MTQSPPYDFCIAARTDSADHYALHTCRLDADGGALHIIHTATRTGPAPGYFATAQTRSGESVLYALGGGEISFLSIGADGALALLSSTPTGSDSPAHLCVDRKARLLCTANYGSGTVSLLPLTESGEPGEASLYAHGPGAHQGAVGKWGEGPQYRQEAAHPHGVTVCGDQLYVSDLGTNQVVCWTIDFARGALHPASAITVHDLAGPRHVQFARSGQVGYVLNELDNTVCVLQRNITNGELSLLQTLSSIPEGWAEAHADPATFPNEVYSKPSHASELQISKDDRFVYASNRGHDSIAVFEVSAEDGALVPRQFEKTRGRIPWIFCLSADDRFMIVQNNHTRAGEEGPDSVVVFRRDAATGLLDLAEARLEFPSVSAVCTL